MVTLALRDDKAAVRVDGAELGFIRLYDNPCHGRNCYVKLELERLDAAFSRALFAELAELIQRPLQAMVSSEDTPTTDFLLAGGFVCKRKCYEVEACEKDWNAAVRQVDLLYTNEGEQTYRQCCEIMYQRYVETHEAVNPWTADFTDFCRDLPDCVIYEKDGGQIINLAFVEGNEIAYIYGLDPARFAGFAGSLVHELFLQHGTVCFESDDCDWAAMELRSMFKNQDETSFDTYVYDYERAIP